MSIREYRDLRGARNHASVEGHPNPPANKWDVVVAAPAVAVCVGVLRYIQGIAEANT